MGKFTKPGREFSPEIRRIRTPTDWNGLLDSSSSKPVVLFKHSTACNISAHVYEEFRQFLADRPETTAGVVHVVEDREVSDAVADFTGIRHESPQIILVHRRTAVWHGSHWDIDFDDLERHLPA